MKKIKKNQTAFYIKFVKKKISLARETQKIKKNIRKS